MKTFEVEFDPLKAKKKDSKERKEFKKKTGEKNIIYLFFGKDECYYIGESSKSLCDRCFTNTPEHSKKDWFDKCNRVVIIQLDDKIGDMERRALESIFILAYKSAGHPLQNKK